MNKSAVTKVLMKHTSWVYTDYDDDQIKCNCGWTSRGFLPRTRDKANQVFASHQSEEIFAIES